MHLKNEDVRKIRKALKHAFPIETGKLDLVVADAGIGISFAELPGSYEPRIQALIEDAAGQYQLTKLLKAAVEAAPNNPDLKEVASFIEQYFTLLPQFLPDRNTKGAIGNAERALFKNVGFENVRGWLEKLDRLTCAVCRIEPQPRAEGIGGYGTGFLVAPDVVLTNSHVAADFWEHPTKAARVRFRFDCEYTTEGKSTDGKEYKLAADYQILRSTADQLDFALLRLDGSAGRPGDDVVRGAVRGFVVPAAYQFQENEPLLILQHPMAEPMKLAFGSVASKNGWVPDRIAYSVNTEGGSSGSPCLTQDLTVVALHHWGSDQYNRGVQMSALRAYWSRADIRSDLVARGLEHLVDGPGTNSGTLVQKLNPVADTTGQKETVHTNTKIPIKDEITEPIKSEIEVKLVSMAVTQFKFGLIDTALKVAAEVRLLCSLLDIKCGSGKELKIRDTYYDDRNRTLAAQMCSIRQRLVEGKNLKVTFKTGKKFTAGLELERDEVEFECSQEEFRRMEADNFASRLAEAFDGNWCQNAACGPLSKSLTVHNSRTQFPVETATGKYEFCFDKFYFEAPDGTFSEYFAEIELETKVKPPAPDEPLYKLAKALCEFLDFEQHKKSKYQQGADWLKSKFTDYKNVHTLTLDIIGHALQPPDVQKQTIQALNRFAKDGLRAHCPGDCAGIVCVPTGSGMIMVFEQNPTSLVPFVFYLQDHVRREHNQNTVANRFAFRGVLHSGPLFRYSDVNERLSYAGNGINMAQRVLALGAAWHLLATQDARDLIVKSNGSLARLFHRSPRKIKMKSGKELVIYNVHDETGHGNPRPPGDKPRRPRDSEDRPRRKK